MNDERPVDLRRLAVDEPDVVRASIRRFRRRVFIWTLWMLVFAAAGAAIFADQIHTRDQNPEALIATLPALNSTMGSYQVGQIDVGLLKVVRLPHNQIGMQFVFHSSTPLGYCCNLYPRFATETHGARTAVGPDEALAGDSRFGQLLIVERVSDFGSSGMLDMLLTNGDPNATAKLGRFIVDLHALHVTGIGG